MEKFYTLNALVEAIEDVLELPYELNTKKEIQRLMDTKDFKKLTEAVLVYRKLDDNMYYTRDTLDTLIYLLAQQYEQQCS